MILLLLLMILLLLIIKLRLCSFHCNCFVCSMLDLIYSSSILIESCRCLPGQKKRLYFFSSLVEKIICFLNMKKTLRKTPDSHGAQLEGRGGISRPLPQWMPLWGDTSIFLSLVCIIMASQRALLVVYLVSLVYVRSAKSLGRDEVVLGEGGTPHPAQTRKLPSIHLIRCSSAPTSQGGVAGKTIFYLIDYEKRKKRNSFFKCWLPF